MDTQHSDQTQEVLRAERMARRAAKRKARFDATKSGRLLMAMKATSKEDNPLALAFA